MRYPSRTPSSSTRGIWFDGDTLKSTMEEIRAVRIVLRRRMVRTL